MGFTVSDVVNLASYVSDPSMDSSIDDQRPQPMSHFRNASFLLSFWSRTAPALAPQSHRQNPGHEQAGVVGNRFVGQLRCSTNLPRPNIIVV